MATCFLGANSGRLGQFHPEEASFDFVRNRHPGVMLITVAAGELRYKCDSRLPDWARKSVASGALAALDLSDESDGACGRGAGDDA